MDQSQFSKPLDTWINETIGQTVTKGKNGEEIVTDLEEPKTFRVRYTQRGQKKGCKKGEHFFVLENMNERGVICTRCGHGRYVIAGVHDIKDGRIINRNTLEVIQ